MKYGTLLARRLRNEMILEEYEGTAVTQSMMAERYGVHVNTIRNWLDAARRERMKQRRRKALIAEAQGTDRPRRRPAQACRRCWLQGHNVLTCTEPRDRYYNI